MIEGDRSSWTIREVALKRLAASSSRPFASWHGGAMETYERFIGAGAKFANVLCDIGIKTQDTVVIFCPSGLPHLHAWMGCALLGATEVPVNTLLRGEPLQHVLRMAKPTQRLPETGKELVPRQTSQCRASQVACPSPPSFGKQVLPRTHAGSLQESRA